MFAIRKISLTIIILHIVSVTHLAYSMSSTTVAISRNSLQERLIKATLQYTLMHHNDLMIKYDIKNIQSSHSPVPRSIADYTLISAILVSLVYVNLIKDLSKLQYPALYNRYRAEKLIININQDFAQSINLQGPWLIDTNGYHNVRQGQYVCANLMYTLQHFDKLLNETYTCKLFPNQPLCSKLLWYSHTKMVSDAYVYPKLLELITIRTH
jgi:hypothetical protein